MAMGLDNLFRVAGQLMNRRSSAFHNIVILNIVVFGFSYLIYDKANTLWVFTPALLVLGYTVYSHEFFARKQPHLLSNWKSVQELGIHLGAMGEKGDILPEQTIDTLPSEPTVKKLSAPKAERRRKTD